MESLVHNKRKPPVSRRIRDLDQFSSAELGKIIISPFPFSHPLSSRNLSSSHLYTLFPVRDKNEHCIYSSGQSGVRQLSLLLPYALLFDPSAPF